MKNRERETAELIKTSSHCFSHSGCYRCKNSGHDVEIILTWFTALVPFHHTQHVYKKCFDSWWEEVTDLGLAE